ncbi:3449_t:CDS:2 [Rhizophagus irregularis]|nr:3449_t:CDS:2 [Rhizophagus irregularis]
MTNLQTKNRGKLGRFSWDGYMKRDVKLAIRAGMQNALVILSCLCFKILKGFAKLASPGF